MSNTKKLKSEELHAFSDELGMMLSSGLPMVQALTMMVDESGSKEEHDLLQKMLDSYYEKYSLAHAIEESGVFPIYYEDMIQMGENTGNLDNVLERLAAHYKREIAINSAIKSAVSYPLMMVAMMLVIIIVLTTKIMPIFERVFNQLGATMSGVSAGILGVGNFLNRFGLLILVLLVFVGVLLFVRFSGIKGKERLAKFACHFKTFKSISDDLAISRFASSMAMTLSSGMDIMQAIEVSGGIAKAPGFGQKVTKCKEIYQETMDTAEAFSKSGIFTGLYGHIAVYAAKSGNTEQVLDKVADTYEGQADQKIADLIAVVEPTMVIMLSVIVGLILLSVMLPLLNIMSGMF